MNEKHVPVGCVVMAAGSARRFGKNKLLAAAEGKTLIERALDAVPADRLAAVCVVTRYPEVEAIAARYGFPCVQNDRPDLGQSRTVRLGVEALSDTCGAIMFLVADQPYLRRESAAALADLYRDDPDRIVCMASAGRRGNPCIFPAAYFPELLALTGDTGGASVIRAHPDRVSYLEADPRELWDIDTPEALARLS